MVNGTLVEQPVVTEQAPAPAPRKLDPTWARVFAIGWPAAVILMTVIEPVSDAEPSALLTFIGTVMFFGLAVAFGGTVVQAAQRNPSAVNWATGAALASVIATVTCPMSGHHQSVGAWFYIQMGLSLGMLVVSRLAAGRAVSSR